MVSALVVISGNGPICSLSFVLLGESALHGFIYNVDRLD
uniref:Uncharacterized protein n=1 Tax=Arundo donax TaxID=35708 RepID=A0A0A9B468_ARUDO